MTVVETGRTRHRVLNRWFKEPVLVLQKEVKVRGVSYSSYPFDIHGDAYEYTEWRDVQPEELLEELSK